MKSRLAFILTSILLALTLFSFAAMWVISNTTAGRVWQLTNAQRHCIQEVTDNPVYVEEQRDIDSVAVGYLINDDFYVAIFDVSHNGRCRPIFQEKVWHLEIFGAGTSYAKKDDIRPQKIRLLRLTNSPDPVIYIWFDILGVGKRTNAKHIFFAKQKDNSYQSILLLKLCVGLSSVEITEQIPPTIMVIDDRQCDWPPSNERDYLEYSLWDEQPVILRAWSTGRFR